MGIETALGVGASLIGGAMSSSAASNAADAQRAAAAESAAAQREGADKSIAAQREMFDIGRADLSPYREGGDAALNRLRSYLGIGGDTTSPMFGKYTQDFTMSDFTTDPGYQFRLEQGMNALNRSAAARGMGQSGANIKGALEYGQNLGSQEYQNAFNRYQTNRASQLDPLFKLYGGGQSAAAGSAVQAGNLGQNLGQTYTNLGQGLGQAAVAGGNAQASGYINQSNALNNALSQGMSSYAQSGRSPYNNFLGSSSPYSYGAGGYTGMGPFIP